MLPLAQAYIRNKPPTCPHKPHKLTPTGKTPLEVSLYEGGVALSRAHFFQADPWERERIEEVWGRATLWKCSSPTEKQGQQT